MEGSASNRVDIEEKWVEGALMEIVEAG